MKIKINSNIIDIDENLSLKNWLETNGYNLDRIAIECDGEIISKSVWNEFILRENASLEIVEFVGGG
ncbi:sulfur carrier protein ThiS [Campylobacter fetus]|uniref:sulfur carrier protein ThiS n=1 Tax=Campylobacter fetus TaxID=196 RepID=UPI000FCA1A7E|nr:sulfur carrier protein ThiS [Campylobacter fetus]QQF52603.1 sulfur carrier protein ThiS [Campylobacter fetus subsp. venerealis]RUT49429.1 thiamine biosynthesis protein ThiS [Campylobacter fetus]RUT49688.1 thiamine biosynthesis protein ThiS [Campylobacter fetus]